MSNLLNQMLPATIHPLVIHFTIMVSLTGYLGGSMVYDHGLGVTTASRPT